MAANTLAVHGLRELQTAFAKADRDVRLGLRAGLRGVAEPVRRDAESLARSEIRNIGSRWPRMRTGVSRKVVYVAPRQKGTHGRGGRRRPNLADLLMDRAMSPALDRHVAGTVRAFEQVLDRAARGFN